MPAPNAATVRATVKFSARNPLQLFSGDLAPGRRISESFTATRFGIRLPGVRLMLTWKRWHRPEPLPMKSPEGVSAPLHPASPAAPRSTRARLVPEPAAGAPWLPAPHSATRQSWRASRSTIAPIESPACTPSVWRRAFGGNKILAGEGHG